MNRISELVHSLVNTAADEGAIIAVPLAAEIVREFNELSSKLGESEKEVARLLALDQHRVDSTNSALVTLQSRLDLALSNSATWEQHCYAAQSRLNQCLEIAQCAQRMTDTGEVTEAIDKLIDVARGVVERPIPKADQWTPEEIEKYRKEGAEPLELKKPWPDPSLAEINRMGREALKKLSREGES